MGWLRQAIALIPLIGAVAGLLCYLLIRTVVGLLLGAVWFMLVAGPLALTGTILGPRFADYRERMRKLRNGRV